MALGRMDEAIETLEAAAELSGQRSLVLFALAVAYDRADDFARARETMERALARDRRLNSLLAARRHFAPPADQDYYLGLGRAAAGDRPHARAHFFRYLSAAADSPWRARALAHLKRLGPPVVGENLRTRGAAELPALERALRVGGEPFLRCVENAPGLAIEISISLPTANAGARPPPRVTVLEPLPQPSLEREAIACAERAASDLRLPMAPELGAGLTFDLAGGALPEMVLPTGP